MKPSLSELKENLEFDLVAYSLEGGVSDQLKDHIARVAEYFNQPRLRGPLFALTQEFAANALKAIYKQVYFTYFVQELGLEEITYEDWLQLFRTEIESHQSENFERVARENNLSVEIKYQVDETFFTIFIRNPGTPSEVELRRIQASLANAHKLTDMSYLFADDSEEDEEKEGAGIGIPLLIMTLRGLGIKPGNLEIFTEEGHTIARIRIPFTVLLADLPVTPQVVSFPGGDIGTAVGGHDLFYLQFDVLEKLHRVSENFLERFQLTAEECKENLPEQFFSDIFRGPATIRVVEKFNSFRLKIEGLVQGKETVFNIIGYLTPDSKVNTIWYLLNPEFEKTDLNGGGSTAAVQIKKMLEPYLPESKAPGFKQNDGAVLFLKISGLLKPKEASHLHEELSFLNIAVSIIANAIRENGGSIEGVDGKEIMAVFTSTVAATIAAMALQRFFIELNHYRKRSGEACMVLKTAIDRGETMGDGRGTSPEKSHSTFGNAVDRAEMILKRSKTGLVYLGEGAHQQVKGQVELEGRAVLRQKDNGEELQVFAVNKMKFQKNELEFVIGLKNPVGNEV